MAVSAHNQDVAAVPIAPLPKAIATALIMAATILVVLDQTIATVALPHMQAALGATPETINWVLTSYILATSVGIPLTGWLAGRVGRGRLFGICILGFTLSSALCGLAVSLPMMVAARLAQMIAYINDFWLMMWIMIAILPLAFLLGRERPPEKPGEMMVVE